MTETQTFTSAHMPEQSLSTEGFHCANWAKVILFELMIWLQVLRFGNPVELVAVANHAGLGRLGGHDTAECVNMH